MKYVFFGNCQVNQIYCSFAAAKNSVFGNDVELEFVDGNAPGCLEALDTSLRTAGALVWQGRAEFKDPPKFAGRILRLPTIYFSTLWPFDGGDPSVEALSELPPRVPRGDSFIRESIAAGKSADQVYWAYRELYVPARVDIKDLFERELETQRKKDQFCDVRIADYIAGKMLSHRLFSMAWHPTNELLRELHDQVALWEFFDLNDIQATLVLTHWAGEERLQPDVPIHPSVIEHLGLQWRISDYNHFGESRQFDDWLIQYLSVYDPQIERKVRAT
ncbi:WcbI family polysaccharide biosynthesis putative acetyltransferase [Novosphingobium sp. Chol11]|uniref:WcbI family polysaccharide biosynthesis putative acetyltransferase n=1 Tax=Novosphingobium sp. Chol11 TaxID=1385763 RepID=UPI001142C6D8|nr:WcbI family polysaccharide biosynthesis putative acetyltransferase [Novosphingobium sp. Chol11]